VRRKLLEATDRLCEALCQEPAVQQHVRRFVCLETCPWQPGNQVAFDCLFVHPNEGD
jgi:hypothetical protein